MPTEAEWEYACRAGTDTPFHFGETISTEVVNYNGIIYGKGIEGEDRGQTTPVGYLKVANAFGLSDMHGNVFEWCEDDYHNYDDAPTDGSAWNSEDDDASRILRGGSWNDSPRNCRSAYRIPILAMTVSSISVFVLFASSPGLHSTLHSLALLPFAVGTKFYSIYVLLMKELPIIQKTYDLIKWYIPIVNRLPRNHRFALGERIVNNLYDLLEGLIGARYAKKDKLARLQSLNSQIDILRYQTRLLLDFQLISAQRYKYINQQLNDIGIDLGGWIKQQQRR